MRKAYASCIKKNGFFRRRDGLCDVRFLNQLCPEKRKAGDALGCISRRLLLGAWNLEHLLLEVGLHAAHLGFGLGALLAALFLNLDDFVEGPN